MSSLKTAGLVFVLVSLVFFGGAAAQAQDSLRLLAKRNYDANQSVNRDLANTAEQRQQQLDQQNRYRQMQNNEDQITKYNGEANQMDQMGVGNQFEGPARKGTYWPPTR